MKQTVSELEKKAQKLLGYNIHMIRMMRGLSQRDLAIKLAKSPNAISSWELGNTSPSIDDLMKICELFDVTPNQILGWDDYPELLDFIRKTKELGSKVEDLRKQKKEIENQIKLYNELMSRKD